MPEDSRVVRVGWDGESLGRAGRTNPSNQFAKHLVAYPGDCTLIGGRFCRSRLS